MTHLDMSPLYWNRYWDKIVDQTCMRGPIPDVASIKALFIACIHSTRQALRSACLQSAALLTLTCNLVRVVIWSFPISRDKLVSMESGNAPWFGHRAMQVHRMLQTLFSEWGRLWDSWPNQSRTFMAISSRGLRDPLCIHRMSPWPRGLPARFSGISWGGASGSHRGSLDACAVCSMSLPWEEELPWLWKSSRNNGMNNSNL